MSALQTNPLLQPTHANNIATLHGGVTGHGKRDPWPEEERA